MNKINQSESEVNCSDTLQILSNLLQQNKHFKILNQFIQQQPFHFLFFVQDKSDSSKQYAIKAQSILNINTGNIDHHKLKSCKEQAQMTRDCFHQNVIQYHSDFQIGSFHFIQINQCINTLDDWINHNQNQINDDLFINFAKQIIDGVEYLHKKGYVVGNDLVKNILVTANGVIKISNFDFPNKFDEALKYKDFFSKNQFCQYLQFPPELFEDIQNNKEQVYQTQKGDIWAIGICLSALDGSKISDFAQMENQLSQIGDQQCLSNKVKKILNYILNVDPNLRPSIEQIKEKINGSYFRNIQHQSILQIQQMNSNVQNMDQATIQRFIDFDSNQVESIYEKYKEYEKIWPFNIHILITLAYIEVQYHSNFLDAKKHFDKCVELNPNEIDAYLGLCLVIIQNVEYKNYKKAFEYLEFCFNITKDYWRVYYIKSWLLYLNDQYKEGFQVLEQGEALKSDCVLIQSLKIYFFLDYFDDLQKAQNLTEEVINFNANNNPLIFLRIGVNYRDNKIYNKAIDYFQQALKYNPKDQKININLCLLYKENDDLEESEKYMQQMLLLYPQSSYIICSHSEFQSDDKKRLEFLESSIQLDEENRYAYYFIAEIFDKQGNIDEVLKQHKKVLQFKPKDWGANKEIGYILAFRRFEYQLALQYYKIIIKQMFYDKYILNQIGKVYEQLEDYEKAIFYFKKCLQVDPQNNYAHYQFDQIKQQI